MTKQNELLLKLLSDSRHEVSQCFSKQISLLDECKKRIGDAATMNAAKHNSSSLSQGLNNIGAAQAQTADFQQAAYQLQEIANDVDRKLENWINDLSEKFSK